MGKELSVVGKRMPLQDAYAMVTGTLKYAVDVSLDGMLYAKVLRSPYAHARIVKIDASRAESLPGVEAVITHKDVPLEEWVEAIKTRRAAPEEEWIELGCLNYQGRVLDERVRFAGDEVAAVAAKNEYVAEEALRLIDVEYEELPHVFDIEGAMKPDAPRVSPHGNVRTPCIVEWGDLEKGFKEADVRVEHKASMGSQSHAPLGLNASIAKWEGDNLTIWTSTQTPFELRDVVAQFLKLPQNKVRVIGLPAGGSFGLWWVNNFHLISVLLAKKARKPVKLQLTREETMATVKRRDIPLMWGKLGVKKDGTFTAIHFKHYFDNGAYGAKWNPFQNVSDIWGGRAPNGKFEMYGVSTNLVTAGCMRGVGNVSLTFCMEQLIDKAAEKLGMNPIEIRLKNHIRVGDQVRSLFGSYTAFGIPPAPISLSSGRLDECIRKGAEIIGWKERWKGWGQPVEVNGAKRRGLGMGVGMHVSSVDYYGCPVIEVRVNHDGSVHLLTGIGRFGSGNETTQIQIAAEELGVPFDSIAATHGDTGICPWCVPTFANMSAHKIGLATQAAAADAKRQICELASEQLGAEPKDLDIKDGRIYVSGQPQKVMPFTDAVGKILPQFLSVPSIVGRGWKEPSLTRKALLFMAHFAEVEVDIETGKVRILRFVAVHESGVIINPEVAENQVSGGILIACGLALVESLVFDEKTGQVLNPNYVDYKLLRALEMPDPEIVFVDEIDPVGPFGIKGLGEGVGNAAAPAVAQAIYNAIGIRFNYVPITPERVIKTFQSKTTNDDDEKL